MVIRLRGCQDRDLLIGDKAPPMKDQGPEYENIEMMDSLTVMLIGIMTMIRAYHMNIHGIGLMMVIRPQIKTEDLDSLYRSRVKSPQRIKLIFVLIYQSLARKL